MQKSNQSYNLVLILQGIFMVLPFVAPMVDGRYDFELISYSFRQWVGFGFFNSGAIIAVGAIFEMKRSFTVFIEPRKSGGLVKSGVFKLCRNPIYLGLLMMCVGWAGAMSSWVSLLGTAVLFIVLSWKISFEEVELIKLFGEDYVRYKKETKKIIPFVF